MTQPDAVIESFHEVVNEDLIGHTGAGVRGMQTCLHASGSSISSISLVITKASQGIIM